VAPADSAPLVWRTWTWTAVPAPLVASGVAIHRLGFGWLVEIADDAIEWVLCE
jgi:hypothetical protein